MIDSSKRTTFMQIAIAGGLDEDDLEVSFNDQVDAWHNSDPLDETPLHEYLGMTWREYADYVECKRKIGAIVNDRRVQQNTTFKPFRCAVCSAQVELRTGPGRVSPYTLTMSLPVPDDFAIPTCTGCNEQYLTVELGERLAQVQKKINDNDRKTVQ